MSDYLQQLERLGQLLERGILTEEEFKAEKARILGQQTVPISDNHDRKPWWQSRKVAIVCSSAMVAVLGVGLGLSALPQRQKYSDASATSPSAKKDSSAAMEGSAETKLGFEDLRSCEPNEALASVLRRLREAGGSTNPAKKVIEVGALNKMVDVQSAEFKAGAADITVAEAALSDEVLGLKLRSVATLSWSGGEGFRLTFADRSKTAAQALAAAGLRLEGGLKQSSSPGKYALLTDQKTFSSLTCVKADAPTPGTSDKPNPEEDFDA